MSIGRLSRRGLDNADAGADAMLQKALRQAESHVVGVSRNSLAVADDHLANVRESIVTEHDRGMRELVWLGADERGEQWVAALGFAGDEAGLEWREARELAAVLEADEANIALQALALAHWHEDHAFSPLDGSATTAAHAGWVRVDGAGRQHFPRTDPAVIVAILDEAGERILLANNAAWPTARYSLVAGFVDPGESLEQAVARETLEEVGLAVEDIAYVASQPWPFPRSIMLGFTATADFAQPQPDGVEIRDARWLTKDEVREGVVDLPGKPSIARMMIDRWLAGDLP